MIRPRRLLGAARPENRRPRSVSDRSAADAVCELPENLQGGHIARLLAQVDRHRSPGSYTENVLKVFWRRFQECRTHGTIGDQKLQERVLVTGKEALLIRHHY